MTVKKRIWDTPRNVPKPEIKTTITNTTSTVINVSPTTEKSDVNSPLEYKKLDVWEWLVLKTWILENCEKRKTINKKHSSYELKHIFERSPDGFYLTNGAFKGAMLDAGYDKHSIGINWCFAIAERSIKSARQGVV